MRYYSPPLLTPTMLASVNTPLFLICGTTQYFHNRFMSYLIPKFPGTDADNAVSPGKILLARRCRGIPADNKT